MLPTMISHFGLFMTNWWTDQRIFLVEVYTCNLKKSFLSLLTLNLKRKGWWIQSMDCKNFIENMQKTSLLVTFMLDTGPKSASDIFRGSFLTLNRQYIASCMGYIVVRSRWSAYYMKMCVKCLNLHFCLKMFVMEFRADAATEILNWASSNPNFRFLWVEICLDPPLRYQKFWTETNSETCY